VYIVIQNTAWTVVIYFHPNVQWVREFILKVKVQVPRKLDDAVLLDALPRK